MPFFVGPNSLLPVKKGIQEVKLCSPLCESLFVYWRLLGSYMTVFHDSLLVW